MSLRAKLVLPLALIGMLIAGYLHVFWIPRTLAADEIAHLTAVDQHLNSVAESLVPLLLGNQLDVLHGNLDALKQNNANWLSIRLVTPEGKQLYPLATAQVSQEIPKFPDMRKIERRVRYLDSDLATLIVQIDLGPGLENTRKEIRELTYILLGMLAILMTTIISTSEVAVRRPVHQLAKAAVRLARMDFDTPLPKAGSHEIRDLVDSFASMRSDLQNYHSSLLHEIAERKDAENALRQLNETLEQRITAEVAANREKDHLLIQQSRLAAMGEMVHNIAHQWRQPLNSLALVIANIQDDFEFNALTAETLARDVSRARRLIDKMSSTIDDFRDFFRPDREKSTFDVAEAVQDAVFIVEAALKNNHIGITVDAPLGLSASGFPSQYAQAVLNLLVNAKEAIQEGNPADGQIRVMLREEEDNAVLTVEDNAGGIPPEVLPRLFDPYFTTKEQGSGIGLYMVKIIIERNMEGKISAANIANGARFTLSIPLQNAS